MATIAPREFHFTAKYLDMGGNVIGTESKIVREQRASIRDTLVQKWLDKGIKTFGDSIVRIEMANAIGADDTEPTFDWFDVNGGKSMFNIEATNKDARNIAISQRLETERQQRDEAEMRKLLEPFAPAGNWIATGYAWDISHSLVKFTGERNRDKKMFRVQPLRKTSYYYYVPAGKPIWVAQENIITLDPMKRVSEVGVMPSKSMYPYFNLLDNVLPQELE